MLYIKIILNSINAFNSSSIVIIIYKLHLKNINLKMAWQSKNDPPFSMGFYDLRVSKNQNDRGRYVEQ